MITWFWLSKEVYRSQTSDLWTEAQLTVVRPVREEKRREEWEEKESVEEDQGARNDRKHISNSKGTKHTILGALLEVDMFKNCTRLWHKVHFGVNMYRTPQLRSAFGSWDQTKKCTLWWRQAHVEVKMLKTTFEISDVEKVYPFLARSTFTSQKC